MVDLIIKVSPTSIFERSMVAGVDLLTRPLVGRIDCENTSPETLVSIVTLLLARAV